MLTTNQKSEPLLLPTTNLINRQFEALGIHLGDNLMIFELYIANNGAADPERLKNLIDQYAQDVDHKLNFYRSGLVADVSNINLRLLSNVDRQKVTRDTRGLRL